MEFGRDGPFMLVPKERGRSTNNQHFCHRAESGFFSGEKKRVIINVTRGEKKKQKKKKKVSKCLEG